MFDLVIMFAIDHGSSKCGSRAAEYERLYVCRMSDKVKTLLESVWKPIDHHCMSLRKTTIQCSLITVIPGNTQTTFQI